MSLPVEIRGKTYLATLPGVDDFRTFRMHLQTEYRKAAFAAIPPGLPDEELKRWMRNIGEECDKIDPFKDFHKLATDPTSASLLFHAVLKRENPTITLQWVQDLLLDASHEDLDALQAFRNLRETLMLLLEDRKRKLSPTKAQPLGQPKQRANQKVKSKNST